MTRLELLRGLLEPAPSFWRRLMYHRLRFGRRRLPVQNNTKLLPVRPETPDFAIPAPPPRRDWPEIQTRHPAWWQVHRIEVDAQGVRVAVLIAEVRTEDEAFRVADRQLSQARVTKWGSKQQPFYTRREPKMQHQPQTTDGE